MYPSVFEHKRKSRNLAAQAKRSPECTTRARLLLLGAVQLISDCLFPPALLFVLGCNLELLHSLPFMEAETTSPSAEHQLHLHDSC